MTQEEKQLLLKDLCARLPYGVVGLYTWKCKESYNRELTGSLYDELELSWSNTDDSQFLPYLRPLSSMTEKEKEEFNTIWEGGFSKALDLQIETDLKSIENFSFEGDYDNVRYLEIITAFNTIQWLLSKHFDLGLIEKGLALEAPKGMYK